METGNVQDVIWNMNQANAGLKIQKVIYAIRQDTGQNAAEIRNSMSKK